MASDETAKQALLSLIQGTEGKAWSTSQTGWSSNSPIPLCEWEGISCKVGFHSGATGSTPANKITTIHLPNSGLSGTLPTQLGQLPFLEELTLKGNLIKGSIPSELATSLKQLNHLDLSDCLLTGTLPPRFESPTLSKLFLNGNAISGTFFQDETSPHLQSMEEIRLEDNLLTGTLHAPTIQQMKKLNTLSLSENELSGIIPGKALGSLPNLQYLYLDSNELVGPLPSNLAQSGISKLEELWVQSNALSGTVPASYERFDKLHDFFIDDNKFTGALSPQLCGPEINTDFFEDTATTTTTTMSLSPMEKNYCDYIACPVGYVGMEGVYPCNACVGGDVAKLQNPYLGQRGDTCLYLSQRDALEIFYEETSLGNNGTGWKGENDWKDKKKDTCELSGVVCDTHANVVQLLLKGRNLAGTIPKEIGLALPFLEVLDVSDNDLTGFLPSDLRWTALTKLDISGNQIRGVVPPMLCMMGELNENGNEDVFYCNRVACPVGTYNALGRHASSTLECKPCYDDNPYIGQKSCTVTINPRDKFWKKEVETLAKSAEGISISWQIALEIVAVVWFIAMGACCYIRYGRYKRIQRQKYQSMLAEEESFSSDSSDDDEDYYSEEEGSYVDDEENQPRKRIKSNPDLKESGSEEEEEEFPGQPQDLLDDAAGKKHLRSSLPPPTMGYAYVMDEMSKANRRASVTGTEDSSPDRVGRRKSHSHVIRQNNNGSPKSRTGTATMSAARVERTRSYSSERTRGKLTVNKSQQSFLESAGSGDGDFENSSVLSGEVARGDRNMKEQLLDMPRIGGWE